MLPTEREEVINKGIKAAIVDNSREKINHKKLLKALVACIYTPHYQSALTSSPRRNVWRTWCVLAASKVMEI